MQITNKTILFSTFKAMRNLYRIREHRVFKQRM